jgi:hypothetical protein
MKKSVRLIMKSKRRAAVLSRMRIRLSAIAVLIALLTSLTVATEAVSAAAHILSVRTELNGGTVRLVEEVQQGGNGQLTITFTGQGVTPSSATVGAGIVHMFVENQSGQEQLTLRVTRQGGALVREINVTGKNQSMELPLDAGQYVLSEANNAGWSCQLTVQ